MKVNTYIVFDDSGRYRYILETTEDLQLTDKSNVNMETTKEECNLYLNEISNGFVPQLDLETHEIKLIEYTKDETLEPEIIEETEETIEE